jgi:uncharacterized protein
MTRPLAVITGASSGIGAVFARKLAQKNYDLLLIARRKDRLMELAATLERDHGIQASHLEADLSTTEGMESAANAIAAETRLALLVNNAGYGVRGLFFRSALEDQQRMHRLHIDATLRLTHAALLNMVPRNEGAVINVSSVAAYVRSPGTLSYAATKSWINVFTEGVYLDLKAAGSRVKVQALCPGFTYTEFHDTMGVGRGNIPKRLWMKADDVVDASLRALETGKVFVIPGWFYRYITIILPRIPTALRLRLEGRSPQSRDRI